MNTIINANYFSYNNATSLIDGTITYCAIPSLTIIKSYAFYNCSSLTEASFPACSYIESYTFYHCTSLAEASFPVCSYIGSYAFYGCTSLAEVSFPVCSYIGSSAFYNCISLTEASFPACSYIGSSAFLSCGSLTEVWLLTESVPTLGSTAFRNTPLSNSNYLGYYGSIFVLQSLADSFKTANNWSLYSERIVGV